MQYTIAEDQIKEAIRGIVRGNMNIDDGAQRIDVELRATRKEQGYTAVVTIVAKDAPPTPSTKTYPGKNKTKKAQAAAATGTVATAKAETPAKAAVTEEPVAEVQADEVQSTEAQDEAPVATRTSLFGGATAKPNNTEAE